MNPTSSAAWLRTLVEVSLDSENVYVLCAASTQDIGLQRFLALEVEQQQSERAQLDSARHALSIALLPSEVSWVTRTFPPRVAGQLTDSIAQDQILRLFEIRLGIAIQLYRFALRTPLPLCVRAVLHDMSARAAARLRILQGRLETSFD